MNNTFRNTHAFLGVSILLGSWFIYDGLGKVSISTHMDTSSISNELNRIAYSLHPEQS